MSILKHLKYQNQSVKSLFWTGQVIGIIFGLFYLVFAGGNIIGELSQGIITFREDYQVFIFLLSLVGIAAGLAVTWFRSKTGAYLIIAFIILGSISIATYTDRFVPILAYIPFLIPGILLLLFAYIKKEDQEVRRHAEL